jgi:glutamate/tyrosine decarboxylase-like PLP-dependent enzyme
MVGVPVDQCTGSMRVDALEAMVKSALDEGKVPFMVGATAGTTVYGGFDDLVGIRDVCDRYGECAFFTYTYVCVRRLCMYVHVHGMCGCLMTWLE